MFILAEYSRGYSPRVRVFDNPRPITGTCEVIEFVRTTSIASAKRHVKEYKRMYHLTSRDVVWSELNEFKNPRRRGY